MGILRRAYDRTRDFRFRWRGIPSGRYCYGICSSSTQAQPANSLRIRLWLQYHTLMRAGTCVVIVIDGYFALATLRDFAIATAKLFATSIGPFHGRGYPSPCAVTRITGASVTVLLNVHNDSTKRWADGGAVKEVSYDGKETSSLGR